MKRLLESIGGRKLFVLIAYLLLSYGALIYASLITLNLDFSWQEAPQRNTPGNTIVAEVPKDIEQASLYLEFRSRQTGSRSIKISSANTPIYEGQMVFEDASNFKNHLLVRKAPKIHKGLLEFHFDGPIEVLEVRAEYRYSALRYYLDAFKNGDTGALLLLSVWILVFAAGLLMWKFGLKLNLLVAVVVGHLFFIWTVFAPMSGYDDTYHLPGAALLATSLPLEIVRPETVKLIKEANYFSLHRIPREVAKQLNAKIDFCPHIVSYPNFTIEECPFSHDFNLVIYSRILRLFNLQSVASVEIGLKIINQIVFLLSVMFLANMCSLLFGLKWSQGLAFTLAASLSFFPMLPQTMTSSHDLLFFLVSSIGLWLMTKIYLSRRHKERALCLLFSFLLVSPFIFNAQVNNKTFMILVVPALALLSFLISSRKSVLGAGGKLYRSSELIWIALALIVIVPLGWYLWRSAGSFYIGILRPFFTGDTDYGGFSSLNMANVFELTLYEIIGSVMSSKIYPSSPVKAFYLFLLLGLGGAGLKRFFRTDKFMAIVSVALFLGVVAILLVLGGLTLSDIWISLRFSYALAPVFWLLFSAGFLQTRDFDTAPALVAIIAVNTIYLPSFVFPLLR